MGDFDELAAGWVVWSDEPDGRTVLTFRPDVFDSAAFPSECLPTIYLAHGARARPPGVNPNSTVDAWYVTLYLEPDVWHREEPHFERREAAVEHARELARAFATGEFDYRGLYQVPREAYLDRLDELTGREP